MHDNRLTQKVPSTKVYIIPINAVKMEKTVIAFMIKVVRDLTILEFHLRVSSRSAHVTGPLTKHDMALDCPMCR